MTAPHGYVVLDGDGGSVLPALPDLACEAMGGLFFRDTINPANLPRSHEHVSMDDFMQTTQLVTRAWQMLPMVAIWAHGNGSSAPVIDGFRSASIHVALSGVTPAHSATGVHTYTLPASVLMALPGPPRSGPTGTAANIVTATQSGNVVTVRMFDAAGSATDAGGYWVEIFGE